MNNYRVTMLVADGTYHGMFFPRAEVARAAKSMLGRPVNLNHSDKIEDIVGHVVDAVFENGKLVGTIALDPDTPLYGVAKRHLDGALKVGATPNVSVEVLRHLVTESGRKVARNLDFTALGIVARGACSDKAGCGVQAALFSEQGVVKMEPETTMTVPTGSTVNVYNSSPEKAELAANVAEKLGGKVVEKLCASCSTHEPNAELESKLAVSEALVVKLTADIEAMRVEAERAPLVAELSKFNAEFPTEGRSVVELKAAIEAFKLAPKVEAQPVAARKTMLAADGGEAPDAKVAFLDNIRSNMGLK